MLSVSADSDAAVGDSEGLGWELGMGMRRGSWAWAASMRAIALVNGVDILIEWFVGRGVEWIGWEKWFGGKMEMDSYQIKI